MKNAITVFLAILSLFYTGSMRCSDDKNNLQTIQTAVKSEYECEPNEENINGKEVSITNKIETITSTMNNPTVPNTTTNPQITEKMSQKETTTKATQKPVIKETTTREKHTNNSINVPKYVAGQTEKEILNLVNQNRINNELSPLTMDNKLCGLAFVRAKEASTKWSHERPNGTRFYTVFTEYGVKITKVGENLAGLSSDPDTVVNAWMNSEGHRKNILDNSYTKTGIAIYTSENNEIYIAQLFEK